MENRSIKRDTAYVVELKEINEGEYVKQEGWNPNYVKTSFGLKVSRINIIGTIIEKDTNSAKIDDSTDVITIRLFDENEEFDKLKTGSVALVIGKIRNYNQENYITPEIIKPIDPAFMKIRKKDIQKIKDLCSKEVIKQTQEEASFDTGEEVVQQKVEESMKAQSVSNTDEILKFIDEEDKGNGVERTKILEKFERDDITDIMEALIMEGDIFEIKPDVYKLLK
ncbi:MAG: OB-fold nucleic acid binding domain-containing protein [Nanobdellota archaeon]